MTPALPYARLRLMTAPQLEAYCDRIEAETKQTIAVSQMQSRLNQMEDLAATQEDADLVFSIMALKERLHLPLTRPCAPPN